MAQIAQSRLDGWRITTAIAETRATDEDHLEDLVPRTATGYANGRSFPFDTRRDELMAIMVDGENIISDTTTSEIFVALEPASAPIASAIGFRTIELDAVREAEPGVIVFGVVRSGGDDGEVDVASTVGSVADTEGVSIFWWVDTTAARRLPNHAAIVTCAYPVTSNREG